MTICQTRMEILNYMTDWTFFFFNVPKFGNIREFIAFYFENVRKFQFSNIKGFHLDHGKSQYEILNTGDILYRE